MVNEQKTKFFNWAIWIFFVNFPKKFSWGGREKQKKALYLNSAA